MDYKHYFDWAGTTPGDKDILRQSLELSLEHWGNPSSIHSCGTDAKKYLEEARARSAKVLGVKPEDLYFTSGGTEGDHIPLLSMLARPQKGSVAVSSLEHPALREMAKMISNCGWKVITIPSDKRGFITPEAVVSCLQDDTAFVTVMAVNNETGAIEPIYEISDAITNATLGKRRPFFHVDCVQAAGKIPLDLNYKGIDSASFSAHKICGPRGIGLLYLAKSITPFLRGGGQEKNIRSGTENVFGATAFSKCLEKYYISKENELLMKRFEEQKKYTSDFIKGLLALPNCRIIPHERAEDSSFDKNFSPWVVQASFHGIPGQVMVRALDAKGFYISTGSACSAGKNSRPILDAMKVSADEKETAVRFSFGIPTTEDAMKDLLEAVKSVCSVFLK
ncbi:MAG: cysteine desulfurase family protein [Treponema sp.]